MAKLIEIDPTAGFCFGVENAIEVAEQNLRDGHRVYGLGSMVHNDEEINRLSKLGLKTITTGELSGFSGGKVIFRAHGEPPSTYAIAAKHNVEIIDATCPIVKKLQQKISKKFSELDPEKEQIVIFGKEGHAESVGLLGQTNNKAILVTDPDNLERVDPEKITYLYSQTTMDPDHFQLLEENLRKLTLVSSESKIVASCSICNQMKRRKPGLGEFARKHNVVIFVSGNDSSNGKMLFEYCKLQNQNTYRIEGPDDIDAGWFTLAESIGISGATSTSVWQLERVKEYLESLISG